MPTSIRETALAVIAARLGAQCPTAVVERTRRAPVDTDKETLPRLVVTGTDWAADESAEPMVVYYTLNFAVQGFAKAKTDILAEQAVASLHALAVAALTNWTPTESGIGECAEEGAEFALFDADESAVPAGEFTARFSMLVLSPLGSPYAP